MKTPRIPALPVMICLALMAACGKEAPPTDVWTWISGSDQPSQPGVYGTKGIPSPSGFPGAREGAVTWRDPNGHVWIFGGSGFGEDGNSGMLNDLWMLDESTLEWTWVSGDRNTDQLGLYGNKGTADPANVPGARYGPATWLDPQGRLWLFGGDGNGEAGSAGFLSDLWKLDPDAGQWTWVGGGITPSAGGTYGTRGTPAAENIPGSRSVAASWVDSQGRFWLFGGSGYGTGVTYSGLLNDLWRYTR